MQKLLDALIAWSVQRRGLVALLTLASAILGVWSLSGLKFDAFPDLTNVQVQVVTASAGMSSLEVEQLITLPIERALGGLPGVEQVRSLSRTGISSVTVVFEDGTSLWHARQLVQSRVDAARAQIPPQAGSPELGPPSTGLGEVYQFTVRSDRHTMPQLARLFERDIAPRLRAVPGVVEVNAWGAGSPQLEVHLDPQRLVTLGVGLEQVRDALEASLGRASGGALVHGAEQVLVRASSPLTTPEALAALPVISAQHGRVTLGQLGQVREGGALTVGLGSVNGRGEALFAMVQLLAGADALATVQALHQAMPQVRAMMPEGVQIEVIYARDKLIRSTLSTVSRSLVEGGLLVIVVLFILLGDWRAGLLVSSVIPLSMLGAASIMRVLGFSGNLMSLGAIDFGLIVDGSIVLVEGIVALELTSKAQRRQAITERAQRTAGPVVFAVGILILVYVPIMGLWGTEGKLFRPMALTVLAALSTALILSLTFVPAVASWWLVPRGEHQTWLMRHLLRGYSPVLDALMRHPKALSASVVALLLGSAALGSSLGLEFVPRLEEGDLVVQAKRLPSISPEQALRGSTRVEAALVGLPEVEAVATRTGAPAMATDPMGMEESDVLIRLAPRHTWTSAQTTEGLIQIMEARLKRANPDAQLGFTQPIEMRFNELLEGITGDVGVKIYGPDLDELLRLGAQVAAALEGVSGAADVTSPTLEGVPGLEVHLRPQALARYGLTARDVLPWIEAVQRGLFAGEVIRAQFRDPVVLLLDAQRRPPLDQLMIPLPRGGAVALAELADLQLLQTPAIIGREQGSRRVLVVCNVRGRDVGSFVREAQARVAAIKPAPGYWITWSGKYEQLQAAASQMAILVPMVLLAILALLFMAFGRWRPTLLISLNVPVALCGGLIALWARGLPLSISAVIGCIALFGIAVMNGIVLLSRAQELHLAQADAAQAASQSAKERLRPVLTTALVAGLGFVPMALASGIGAEVQRPLATVVIGGLITSTVLTLLVLPTLYAWVYAAQDQAMGLASSPQDHPQGVDGALP